MRGNERIHVKNGFPGSCEFRLCISPMRMTIEKPHATFLTLFEAKYFSLYSGPSQTLTKPSIYMIGNPRGWLFPTESLGPEYPPLRTRKLDVLLAMFICTVDEIEFCGAPA
jgi:hypothetical protein